MFRSVGSGGLALELPAVAGRDWLTNEAVQPAGPVRGVARKRCDAHDPPESGVPTVVLVSIAQEVPGWW